MNRRPSIAVRLRSTGMLATLLLLSAGCGFDGPQPAHGDGRIDVAPAAETPALTAPDDGRSGGMRSRESFPSASNTGPQGQLTPYDGPLIIRDAGTVVENVEIVAPQVLVAANDVTFRNVRFVYSGEVDAEFAMVAVDPRMRGTTFEGCEIDGRNGTARAIVGTGGISVRSCNIHNVGNGVEVQSDFTVENSWIHDIGTRPGTGWHADGVQTRHRDVQNVKISNNTILLAGDETSAVNIVVQGGYARSIEVAGNLVGGGSYTFSTTSAEQSDGFRVVNNSFTQEVFPKVGRWGAWYPGSRNIEASGNTIVGTDELIEPVP